MKTGVGVIPLEFDDDRVRPTIGANALVSLVLGAVFMSTATVVSDFHA